MKNKNLYYGLSTGIITLAVIMRIAHIGYADLILTLAFVLAISLQSWHIFQLEKTLNRPAISTSLFNRASSFLVIGAVALKMTHVPYADILLIFAFLTSMVIKSRHIRALENKINEQKIPSS